MVVAEIGDGVCEYICAHCGRASDVVASLVAAVGKGGGYEEVEEGENWEVHCEGFWLRSWVGKEGSGGL